MITNEIKETTSTSKENVEVIPADFPKEDEQPIISHKEAEKLLKLGERQTDRVLAEEGLKGFKIRGKGNRNWYYQRDVERIAYERGAGSGENPKDHKKALMEGAGGQLASINDKLLSRVEVLSQQLGNAQFDHNQVTSLRKRNKKLRRNLRVERNKRINLEQQLYKNVINEGARDIVRKNSRLMLIAALLLIFIILIFLMPIISKLMMSLFASISAI